MALSLDELCKEVLALPAEQREIVRDAVSESLGIAPLGLHPAWRDEINRRLDDYHAGRTEAIPWEVFEKELDSQDDLP